MWDHLDQTATSRLTAIAGTILALSMAGCQHFSKATWPVTARGAQPIEETSPERDAPLVRQSVPSTNGAASPTIIRVAHDYDAPDANADTESWFSDDPSGSDGGSKSESMFQPGFAGGLSSPIDRHPGLVSIDSIDEDHPNNKSGLFGSGVNGDGPTFGDTEGQPVEEFEPRISFKDDVLGLPALLWNDAKAIVTWPNVIVLGVAAGGAVAVRDNLDQRVRNYTAEHPLRWGEGSVDLRQFGEYSYQVPVLAGVYALSLWTENDRLHEFSVAAFSAYGLTAVSTVAIKGVTNTSRPTTQFENGHYGFPSYHAASTFTIAACVEEYYGWQLGLPAYALAGLVGWSRIDQREHDLSDVLFGSVLGFVIGKSVSAAHLDRRANMKITPYYDSQNRAAAVSFEKRF